MNKKKSKFYNFSDRKLHIEVFSAFFNNNNQDVVKILFANDIGFESS